MAYLSVSTWSLHRLLGPMRLIAWDAEAGVHRLREQPQPELLTLLELPREAARRGYRAIEACHFHFASTEPAYLAALRQAFADAGVAFDTLLLDCGDPTSTDERRVAADLALMRRWIGIAAEAGANRIRIVAGEAQPGDDAAIERAAVRLNELAAYGAALGVRVVTENFKPLTSTGASCAKLLALLDEKVGWITDFGNFKAPDKYAEFGVILPRSFSVHAKPQYDADGIPDAAELGACLDAVKASGYDGAVVLIYDGPGDMWAGLERVRALVEPMLSDA